MKSLLYQYTFEKFVDNVFIDRWVNLSAFQIFISHLLKPKTLFIKNKYFWFVFKLNHKFLFIHCNFIDSKSSSSISSDLCKSKLL